MCEVRVEGERVHKLGCEKSHHSVMQAVPVTLSLIEMIYFYVLLQLLQMSKYYYLQSTLKN